MKSNVLPFLGKYWMLQGANIVCFDVYCFGFVYCSWLSFSYYVLKLPAFLMCYIIRGVVTLRVKRGFSTLLKREKKRKKRLGLDKDTLVRNKRKNFEKFQPLVPVISF